MSEPYHYKPHQYDEREELLLRIERLTDERDEARRMYCKAVADRGIAMVAEDWKGEPVVEEKDCYGREIIHVDRIYQGPEF